MTKLQGKKERKKEQKNDRGIGIIENPTMITKSTDYDDEDAISFSISEEEKKHRYTHTTVTIRRPNRPKKN